MNMKKLTFKKVFCTIFSTFAFTSLLVAQDIPADMSGFRDQVGSTFLYYVIGDDGGQCWGGEDKIFSDDSPLAVAAVHAGILKAKETKLVKVKVLGPKKNLPSIDKNGVKSEACESCDGSYQLSAPTLEDFADAPSTMSHYIGIEDFVFVFRVKAHKEGAIWGGKNNIYTSDSEIATAAIHAGVLKPGQTGLVRIKMLPGQQSYPEITRNGLTSHSFDSWEGSYQFIDLE